jgi:hypothetical protein
METLLESLFPAKDTGEFLKYITPLNTFVDPPEMTLVEDEVIERSWKKRTFASDPEVGAVSVTCPLPVTDIGAYVWVASLVL